MSKEIPASEYYVGFSEGTHWLVRYDRDTDREEIVADLGPRPVNYTDLMSRVERHRHEAANRA